MSREVSYESYRLKGHTKESRISTRSVGRQIAASPDFASEFRGEVRSEVSAGPAIKKRKGDYDFVSGEPSMRCLNSGGYSVLAVPAVQTGMLSMIPAIR